VTANPFQRPHLLIAAAVFVLALGVYTATLAPTISFWDCGEFVTCAHIVGIPHQPGTPLYVLVGRVFDILLGNPDIANPSFRSAWAINLMSAFFSALAVAFVYLIVLDLSRRADPDAGWLGHAGALVGALFLLFSQTYWNNAIEAEVYGLAAFMMALVTWLGLRWYDWRREPASDLLLILIVYLLGLGVGFHLGSLLVYPGLIALILADRRGRVPTDIWLISIGLGLFLLSTMVDSADTVLAVALLAFLAVALARGLIQSRWLAAIGIAVFVLGLSVHAMMLIRAGATPEPAVNQTDPDNLKTLLSVLRREQYPTLNPFQRQADLSWQFGYYYRFLGKQFYFLGDGHSLISRISTFIGPIFLALLGVIHGLRRARPLVWLIIVGYLINSHGLTLMLNFSDHEVRERDYFYFAAFMFAAVFIGLGAAALLRFAAGPEGKSAGELAVATQRRRIPPVPTIAIGWLPRIAAVVLIGVAALPLLLARGVPALGVPPHRKWFEHDRSQNRIAYDYAYNILAGLDANAILFTNGDNDTFPIWYLQEVEHYRRDVAVVNLSLVNLPWYVEQIRRREPALDMTRTDAEVRRLRPYIAEDPNTGERRIVYVRDYVVNDIVMTNARKEDPRPVFFAVTIPRENMDAYFPYLQMEGLAYRLTRTKGEEDLPKTDGERLLENFFGLYRLASQLTEPDEPRQALFAEMVGWGSEVPRSYLDFHPLHSSPDYDALVELAGERRTDVFRNEDTRFLLGNYSVALVRAGYELRKRAYEALRGEVEDTARYEAYIGDALAAFELAVRLRPESDLAAELYPLLLMEHQRDEEALAYLGQVAGKITEETEARTVRNTVIALAQVGRPQLAANWLEGQIAAAPDRKIYYDGLFQLYLYLERPEEAADVMRRWQEQSGRRDPAMEEALRKLLRQLSDSASSRGPE
jgi:hypothetical protein